MTKLSPEAKSLLDAQRASFEPDPARLARVHASLVTGLGIGSAGTGGAAAKAAVVATSTARRVVLTVLAGVIGVGAIALTLRVLWPSARTATTPQANANAVTPSVSSAAESASVPTVPSATPAPPPGDAPVTAASAKPAPRSAGSASSGDADSLAEELALMREARSALSSGNPAGALALLDQHAARYPRGTLTQERLATRIFALCALGRTSQARAEALRFERAAPKSPLLPRIHASCAGSSDTP